jgi:hypothetical protein
MKGDEIRRQAQRLADLARRGVHDDERVHDGRPCGLTQSARIRARWILNRSVFIESKVTELKSEPIADIAYFAIFPQCRTFLPICFWLLMSLKAGQLIRRR